MAAGLLVGAVIVILIVAPVITSFVLGIGVDQGDAALNQVEGEHTVEAFYQNFSAGEDAEAMRYLHSGGPAADDLTTTPGNRSLSNSNAAVRVLQSTVDEKEDTRIVLSVKLEFEAYAGQSDTRTVRVDLRTEDGELRIWQFL